MGDVRKMVDRIERAHGDAEWAWDQLRPTYASGTTPAARSSGPTNEFTKKARLAVLELMQAAAGIHSAAIKLGRAMQKIETDEIPIADEEMEMVQLQIASAAEHRRQAQAAVSGSSGTDWDAALAR